MRGYDCFLPFDGVAVGEYGEYRLSGRKTLLYYHYADLTYDGVFLRIMDGDVTLAEYPMPRIDGIAARGDSGEFGAAP